MRPHLIVLVAILSLLPKAALAQTDQVPFRIVTVNTGGPIAIDAATLGGRQSTGMLQATLRFQAGLTCVNVHNADARTATLVRYVSAYYDATGARVGGESFSRKASFTTGTPVLGFDRTIGIVHENGCIPIHYPKEGIAADMLFVDHVEFADGTTWDATDVHLPENTGTAFLAHARPAAPRPITGTVIELPPVVAGAVASCAAAQRIATIVTPTFQGSVPMPYDADRNVILQATTDKIEASGFHVAASAVCRPATDGARTTAAQALLVGSAVPFANSNPRVYFPYLSTTTHCSAPSRVMILASAEYTPRKLDQAPGMGAYVATISIQTNADGTAHEPVVKNSSGRPELDDASLKAAAASRYWPAVRDGSPVTGEADVSFGWEFDAATHTPDGKTSISSRQFASDTPPAPDC